MGRAYINGKTNWWQNAWVAFCVEEHLCPLTALGSTKVEPFQVECSECLDLVDI